MKNKRVCFQWSVYLVELNSNENNIQQGLRPCICVSNDINNTCSNIAQFIPLTSQNKKYLPIHFFLSHDIYKFLRNDSIVLVEQLTTQPINNIVKFLGRLNEDDIEGIKNCIKLQFNL